MQAGADDLGKAFGHEFLLPVGKELSRGLAAKAARQAAGAAESFAHPTTSTPTTANLRAGSNSGAAAQTTPASARATLGDDDASATAKTGDAVGAKYAKQPDGTPDQTQPETILNAASHTKEAQV